MYVFLLICLSSCVSVRHTPTFYLCSFLFPPQLTYTREYVHTRTRITRLSIHEGEKKWFSCRLWVDIPFHVPFCRDLGLYFSFSSYEFFILFFRLGFWPFSYFPARISSVWSLIPYVCYLEDCQIAFPHTLLFAFPFFSLFDFWAYFLPLYLQDKTFPLMFRSCRVFKYFPLRYKCFIEKYIRVEYIYLWHAIIFHLKCMRLIHTYEKKGEKESEVHGILQRGKIK